LNQQISFAEKSSIDIGYIFFLVLFFLVKIKLGLLKAGEKLFPGP
jgi:hypothetical protein